MGHKHSTDHSNKACSDSESPGAPRAHNDQPSAPIRVPTICDDGLSIFSLNHRLLALAAEAVPDCYREHQWRLLYSLREGRSFPRLVRHVCGGGPTVTVLQLQPTECDGESPSMIILAYSGYQWKSLAERRGIAQSNQPSSPMSRVARPIGFFGDSNSFIAVWSPRKSTMTQPDDRFVVCRPKHSMSNPSTSMPSAYNYMYLVDEDEIPNAPVGIGMGGNLGRWAWFVGEDLEMCVCSSSYTFEQFDSAVAPGAYRVLGLDIFSVDQRATLPQAKRELERKTIVKQFALDAAGVDSASGGKPQKSILHSNAALEARAVLELGKGHDFYSDRPE